MGADDLGPLAAALAKAQMSFPPITRDKHVTVSMKTGGSYSFDYAPLESILAATRRPLSENGLALVQILDDGMLVTRLIHESGASLTGRVDLPAIAEIQAYGSAITYLRRYAIQAVLGIAAEDDDDGNRADGNTVAPRARAERGQRAEAVEQPRAADGSLIGSVAIGNAWLEDCEARQLADGRAALGFRLRSGRQSQKVQAVGPIATALAGIPELVGQTVTCWGQMVTESFTPKGQTFQVDYQILRLDRIHGSSFDIPAQERAEGGAVAAIAGGLLCEATSDPAYGDVEECALDAGHCFPDGKPSPHQGASGSKWPNRRTAP